MISKTAIVYSNVKLGKNCIIEDFAVVGATPKDYKDDELETIIGDNALIRSHTVIYAGNKIGNNFQTGNKANIREFNEIGNNVSIGTLSVIEHHIKIGNSVRIHSQVFIPEFTILKDECWIGPGVVITNAKYPKSPNAKKELKGAFVEKNAIIGANSTILPGVKIGKHSLIGAGTILTKDIPENAVVSGNPPKIVKDISDLPYLINE